MLAVGMVHRKSWARRSGAPLEAAIFLSLIRDQRGVIRGLD